MNTALIITTYNWVEALELCLKSVLTQSRLPDEIIIADDGSDENTRTLLDKIKNEQNSLNLIHSWQEDKGFRLAASRNRAIAKSSSEYVIIVDGDMILDKNFVHDHITYAKKRTYLQGSRVFLSKKMTEQIFKTGIFSPPSFFCPSIKNNINRIYCPFFSNIAYRQSKNIQKGIRGCNFSFFKEDLLRVNGFNEDFITWGREDSEFVTRLYNVGIKRRNLKFAAIQYHLYHKEGHARSENDELLQKAIDQKLTWCENGIDKYLR